MKVIFIYLLIKYKSGPKQITTIDIHIESLTNKISSGYNCHPPYEIVSWTLGVDRAKDYVTDIPVS